MPETILIDTVSQSQEEYVKAVRTKFQENAPVNHQIQSTCEAFLAIAKASVREREKYDCSQLVAKGSLNKNTIQYRLTEYEYQSALNKALGWQILRDELVLSDFIIQIKGRDATASVVESYTYFQTDGFDSDSFRRKMYTFTLRDDGRGWEIIDVTTNDPWEREETFTYEPIDVSASVKEALLEIELATLRTPIQNDTQDVIPSSLFWPYTPNAAIIYAEAHYRQEDNNPVFGYNEGVNCQNFASQCVWAGLGGYGTDTTAIPAISTQRVGSSAPNIWCNNEYTSYYSEWYFNHSWVMFAHSLSL